MNTFRILLRPCSVFGSPLVGDMLFGHVCWAVRERFGEQRLSALLDGYAAGRPYLVLSDAFPAGLLPRPTVPDSVIGRAVDPKRRRELREARWLPSDGSGQALAAWLDNAVALDVRVRPQVGVLTQNSIHRLTGTTGTGMFAPRQVEVSGMPEGATLDVYAVIDQDRFDVQEMRNVLDDIGAMGYGRDATTGAGKFVIDDVSPWVWPGEASSTVMTLAPCAPDPGMLSSCDCHYLPVTRFGRHGNLAVRSRVPFKRPIMMMRTGALLALRTPSAAPMLGRGLGGEDAPISSVLPATVHQGYAPVVPVRIGSFS